MLDYFVVNAFTERPFAGNPAGVCVLTEQLEAAQMQRIAAENRLPETAFLLGADGHYSLRWFTPLDEIDLCGHGTLAAAFVVMNHLEPGRTHVAFETASGLLTVERQGARFEMRLPRRDPRPVAWTPVLAEALQLRRLWARMKRGISLWCWRMSGLCAIISRIMRSSERSRRGSALCSQRRERRWILSRAISALSWAGKIL